MTYPRHKRHIPRVNVQHLDADDLQSGQDILHLRPALAELLALVRVPHLPHPVVEPRGLNPVPVGILMGGVTNVVRHEDLPFRRWTLRARADAPACERSQLPHRANRARFPLRRIARQPSFRPGHHRIAGGRCPAKLGSDCLSASRPATNGSRSVPSGSRFQALPLFIDSFASGRFGCAFEPIAHAPWETRGNSTGPRPWERGIRAPKLSGLLSRTRFNGAARHAFQIARLQIIISRY